MSALTTSRIRTANDPRLRRCGGRAGTAIFRCARRQGAHPTAHLAGHLRLAAAPGRPDPGMRGRPRACRTGAERHGRRADHHDGERHPVAGPRRWPSPWPAPGSAQGPDLGPRAAARCQGHEHGVGVPAVQHRRQDGRLAHRGRAAPGPAVHRGPARAAQPHRGAWLPGTGRPDRRVPGRAARHVPRGATAAGGGAGHRGHAPGEYSNKVDVELSATMPAQMALAAVLLRLLDTLEANVAGTTATSTPSSCTTCGCRCGGPGPR